MNADPHIVQRQVVELLVSSPKRAEEAQALFAGVWEERLEALVERLFTERYPPGELRTIDRLELDLGSLTLDRFEEQIPERLERALRDALEHASFSEPEVVGAGGVPGAPGLPALLARVLHVLRHGTLPWWSAAVEIGQLAAELDEILQSHAAPFREQLLSAGLDPRIAARLVQQFGTSRALAVTALLAPEVAPWAERAIQTILQTDRGRREAPGRGGAAALLQAAWQALRESAGGADPAGVPSGEVHRRFLLALAEPVRQVLTEAPSTLGTPGGPSTSGQGLDPARRPHTPPSESATAGKTAIPGDRAGAAGKTAIPGDRAGAAGQPPGEGERKSFLRPAEPAAVVSGRPADRPSGPPIAGAPEAGPAAPAEPPAHASQARRTAGKSVEPHPRATQLWEAEPGTPESGTPERTERAAQAEYPADTADAIPVDNAGLILVGPYLGHLFDRAGYRAEGQWRSDEAPKRAVHLLHYLVFASEGVPEHALLLDKLLCGLDPQEPVAYAVGLEEEERNEAELLLESVIHHWTALKSTSKGGLRRSFLRREGLLDRIDSGWRLRVERRAYDMLLDRLPWGLGMIRLPWMPYSIEVEW